MKQLLLISKIAFVATIFLSSCTKETLSTATSEDIAKSTITAAATTQEWNNLSIEEKSKLNLKIKQDPDWQIVVEGNAFIMDRLINSQSDINTLDFNNEETFLKAIGMSKNSYLDKVKANKEAANRLISKLKAMGINPNTCVSCSQSLYGSNASIEGFRSLVKKFKADKSLNKTFLAKMTTNSSNMEESLVNGDSRSTTNLADGELSCPADAYICAGVCAATIEAFPVYLACCYLCYQSYCK